VTKKPINIYKAAFVKLGSYNRNQRSISASSCLPCPIGPDFSYLSIMKISNFFHCIGKNSYSGSPICCESGTYISSSICPVGYSYSLTENSCYFLNTNNKTWSDASLYCRSNGNGRLVTINSMAENNFVKSMALGNTIWIGLNDIVTDGIYTWEYSSEASSLMNWSPDEPNNYHGNEDCGQMYSTGYWNDNNCKSLFAFVCESDSIPNSVCTTCLSGIRLF
jgi:hypothetical protein